AKAFSEPGIQGPVTLRILRPDGTTRVVEAMGHNRLDDPAVEGVVVTTRDISERVEAEISARRSDARLRALVENLSDVVTIVNPAGELIYTSPTAEALFGFRPGDESWTDPTARMHPDDRDAAIEQLGLQIAGDRQEPVQFRLRDAAGGWRDVEAIARDMTNDPDVEGIVVTTRDVSARRLAERLVTDQAQVLTLIARGAPLLSTLSTLCEIIERIVGDVLCGILVVDPERPVLGLGAGPHLPAEVAAVCENIPVRRMPAAGRGTAVILDIGADPRSAGFRDVAARHAIAGVWSTPIFDSLAKRVIGTVAMFLASPREPTAAEREILQMFSQTAAIAVERQAAEDLLAHRANHDSLTGLPNRVLFLEFLSNALARAEREGGKVAVLFLDLDRFKHINDGLGHDAGDEVLRTLASRLHAVMRPADVVARFGGDEFTVLCDGLDPDRVADHITDIARRLLDVVEEPLSVGGEDRRLSASVGIAVAGPGCTAENLLRDSDAAMYEAKQRGKARWEIFDDDMRSSMTARLDLESRLERAIERNEFRLFLQPMIELATGRCVGAEALLRWQDPDKGLVTPDAFIGLAEETGLIIPIGEWALTEACRTVAQWEAAGLLSSEFMMSVNLSARQVAQADLVERVHAAIQRSGPMASRLCLEITESVLMEESSVDAMHALRELGVRFSIDDFGTGYSSLGYLKRFPVDSVKVDRSFVDGLGTDSEDSAIVAAVVSLGHALGLSVVAEGVETSGQLQHLLALGCDRAQGYWFSGPRDAREFAGLLNDQPWVGGRSTWAGGPAPADQFGSQPAP
ncbi:MAG: EAL domain-containing protein, partial [Acidimicrobiia bacterium]